MKKPQGIDANARENPDRESVPERLVIEDEKHRVNRDGQQANARGEPPSKHSARSPRGDGDQAQRECTNGECVEHQEEVNAARHTKYIPLVPVRCVGLMRGQEQQVERGARLETRHLRRSPAQGREPVSTRAQ